MGKEIIKKNPPHTVSAYDEGYSGPFSGTFNFIEYWEDLTRKEKSSLQDYETFHSNLRKEAKEVAITPGKKNA